MLRVVSFSASLAACFRRQLNFYSSMALSNANDPRNFSFVPAFAFANALLDVPVYLCFAVIWAFTYTPIRTTAGGSRKLGPKIVAYVICSVA